MTRSARAPLLLAATAALALAMAPAAWAAPGLSVSPVSLEFDKAGAARALEVTNPGDVATQVQIRLFAWRAEDGVDQEAPSADIGFSPPMFRLEAGARQTVRFAVQAPADGHERAYRLFVEQLPQASEAGKLQMPVRMILPLFVEPSGAVRATGVATLRWEAAYDAQRHRVRLTAFNAGTRRFRLLELTCKGPDGRPMKIAPGLAGYVLAGQRHSWDFDYSGPAGALSLTAGSDQGDIAAQALLQTG